MSTVASPPSGSPTRNNSLSELNEKNEWEWKRDNTWNALITLEALEEKMKGIHVRNISTLRDELTDLGLFYAFLSTTGMFVDSDQKGYFSVLPLEIIHLIFTFLDHISLFKVSLVCKTFRDLSIDETLWEEMCHRNNIDAAQKTEEKTWKWLAISRLNIWRENQNKNGPGTFYFAKEDGGVNKADKYSGDWIDNKREGYGVYEWAPSSSYTGYWGGDHREGHGVRLWPNGNKYIGEYANHKRHGNGEFTFTNGSVFRGRFNDNKFSYGTYTWPNHRVYTGEWNNVYRHGKGHYSWPDGRTYEGNWKKDKRHGEGIYTWDNGDQFVGNFAEGKRKGLGILRLKSGDVYEQLWNEDRFDENFKGTQSSPIVTAVKIENPHPLLDILRKITPDVILNEENVAQMSKQNPEDVQKTEEKMEIENQKQEEIDDDNNNNNNNEDNSEEGGKNSKLRSSSKRRRTVLNSLRQSRWIEPNTVSDEEREQVVEDEDEPHAMDESKDN
eukprot:TRINITY_DN4622_c0_g1_i2.p1 TRINITY_DN4622_c0_g1~~TRINITY_DN4622_c0_g1_i2.p1  ORF type:complete len:498 (+),score=161.52 TRINITY_DN4622_c0_g1_i2:243-1736(+)